MNDPFILLAESDYDTELRVRRAFETNNLMPYLTVVRDGAGALDLLLGTDGGPAPDAIHLPSLLLLDLELPKITGLEILKRLRSNPATKALPVVILTSSNEERDVRRSYHLGVNCYLRKPLEFGSLVDAIRQLGLYWLDLDDSFGATMRNALK